MQSTNCMAVAPQPQMREQVCLIAEKADKANEMLDAIAERLCGDDLKESCEKACAPQNVQNGMNRIEGSLNKLIGKLDGILSRI